MGDESREQLTLPTNTIFALLEDTRAFANGNGSFLFMEPVEQIVAYDRNEIEPALRVIDRARQSGKYLAGYISYEAGYHFVDKQNFKNKKTPQANNQPLIHFCIFSRCIRLTNEQADNLIARTVAQEVCAVFEFDLSESKDRYMSNLEKIHHYIREGDTYQVNHTLKYRFKYEGSALALYRELRKRQPVEYAAFLNFPENYILSLSPELFIRKTGRVLESKPMKGTARRGGTEREDEQIIQSLKNDPKIQSENVMIVDLIRNDIGRLAEPGSVQVENLFEVQTFKTLHQVISTIKGNVDEHISIFDIVANLFPCGSITGAPKIRTMEIIEELEADTRGVYTGAIGYIMPNNDFCFNVPIRTIVSPGEGRAEMGIGSGIIFEADAEEEYKECLLKSKFLTDINDQFQLIEAILFNADADYFVNLNEHLARLKQSASIFGFACDPERVISVLIASTKKLVSGLYKARLLLYKNGEIEVNLSGVKQDIPARREVLISRERSNSQSIFLRHKTTMRKTYDTAYAQASAKGAYDVIFFNEKEQLTEASRHNLFVEKSGILFTPTVSSGLLPGVYRDSLICSDRYTVIEKELYYDDLIAADRIYLTNAIRGLVEVKLADDFGKNLK